MSVTLEIDEEEPTPGLLPDGRPDPAYAAGLGLVHAPFSRRTIAFVIDLVILVVLAIPAIIGFNRLVGELSGSDTPAGLLSRPGAVWGLILLAAGELLLNVFIIVQLVLHGRKGLTVGKSFVHIRSVNAIRFDRPGFWRMVLRALVLVGSSVVVPFWGGAAMLASPLWDRQKRGRGWLDFVGQNWLIDIANGLNPYDLKALRHARRRLEEPDATPEVGLPSLATGAQSGAPQERSPLFAPGSRSHSAIVGGMQLTSARQSDAVTDAAPPAVPAVPSALPGVPTAPPQPAGAVPPPPVMRSAAQPPVIEQSAAQMPADKQQPPAPPQAPQTAPSAAVQQASRLASPTPRTTSASPPPPSDAPASAMATLIVFDTGLSFEVTAGGLIGRNPEPRPGESGQELLSVPDDSLSVSKTHAAFGVDADGFWVSDRGSRNGIAIRSADGASAPVAAGDRAYVRPGDTVFLGQRSFVVRSA